MSWRIQNLSIYHQPPEGGEDDMMLGLVVFSETKVLEPVKVAQPLTVYALIIISHQIEMDL